MTQNYRVLIKLRRIKIASCLRDVNLANVLDDRQLAFLYLVGTIINSPFSFWGKKDPMYELEYVKKKKRKKRALIIGCISTTVVTALSIVAFLGRFVGTFTVSLDTGTVKLTLSQRSTFVDSTSFLRVDNLVPFQEFTYEWFVNDYSEDKIDSEYTSTSIGYRYGTDSVTVRSMRFFKYTFFVKNIGDTPARYDFTINVLDKKADRNGQSLDSTLRVMLYENDDENTHNRLIFGKAIAPHQGDDGEPDYRPPISYSEERAELDGVPFPGYVDRTFLSDKVIAKLYADKLNVNQYRRYTIVTWLEGYLSGYEDQAPTGARIKLGVEINAYED